MSPKRQIITTINIPQHVRVFVLLILIQKLAFIVYTEYSLTTFVNFSPINNVMF